MARSLREQPPSSSVARLFDVDAASRALKPLPSNEIGHEPLLTTAPESQYSTQHVLESPPIVHVHQIAIPCGVCIKRDFVLSDATDETLSKLVDLFRRAPGTRVSASHVVRAMLRGVSHCLDSLQVEVKGIGRLKLPANARGREEDRDRFEDRIAEAFINGIRAASAYRRRD